MAKSNSKSPGGESRPPGMKAQAEAALQTEREQRLAKALRDNLRRRKSPPAQVAEPSEDA